ncbi:MAG: alanine--tRNA ligase [Thermoplasmata archaeon]|nr:alanine--tRNA ligase [Thermoplasmata archaeon]
MDDSEYDLPFFHRQPFTRGTCEACGHAFWSLGEHSRCQESPCTPYGFLGKPGFKRARTPSEMREEYLSFFEHRGHTRLRRYPTVARWRNDVFFTQASIYDFQPWVTSGAIPPPANPLTISQPCLRFIDLDEVGVSGRHFTVFEMMAHHAFNRPDHEVYFKDRTLELCHELLTSELGADPRAITYKEEVWEGGGNLGPSISVGTLGLELATLVFMEYVRDGEKLVPMPLTVVDTGYGLERFTWFSQGTRTAYEAVFGSAYDELRATFPAKEATIVIDHARALNFLLTDGVVPSNSKAGYFSRLLLRRLIRTLSKASEAPELIAVLDRVGREIARDHPEIGEHRDDMHRVVEAEVARFQETLTRGKGSVRRQEERLLREGRKVSSDDLVEWYDSLGLPPDLAVEELSNPPAVPGDFYAQVSKRHENESPTTDYVEPTLVLPAVPASVPPTEVLYYRDPYTLTFESHVVFSEGPFVVLDRTYFYPTGGGQITDTGELGGVPVVEVLRKGPHVLHRLERASTAAVGTRLHGKVDQPRRLQLMQHHTATHLLNGALREVLGPHVWQAGAYKGTELARIDVTHFRALLPEEQRRVERRVHQVIREDRPVKSYFEARGEAERRFGFTLYQGGAVPGKELRIVEVEGFDTEACGGTHCTHTSEVGLVLLLGTERIQDGVVRLTYAAGERALDLLEAHERSLSDSARKLGVPIDRLSEGIDRLLEEREESRKAHRAGEKEDIAAIAQKLLADPAAARAAGEVRVIFGSFPLDRAQLMELSRILTKPPNTVAVLAGEREGKGYLFAGSTAPTVSAASVLGAAKAAFGGKGGGNPSSATAEGEPGTPLAEALRLAREKALSLAGG